MTKEFVKYEQALALKELGFNEPCLTYYHENQRLESEIVFIKGSKFWNLPNISEIAAPTYSQAFRWFREKHDLPSHIAIYWQHDWNNYSYEWNIVENHKQWNVIEHFKTYEEAESAYLN